jgi:hypothetical protein
MRPVDVTGAVRLVRSHSLATEEAGSAPDAVIRGFAKTSATPPERGLSIWFSYCSSPSLNEGAQGCLRWDDGAVNPFDQSASPIIRAKRTAIDENWLPLLG